VPTKKIPEILDHRESSLLSDWIRHQTSAPGKRVSESQLRSNARDFLTALRDMGGEADGTDINRPEWSRVREVLADLSRQRATQGYTPTETATFVLSFKQALFDHLRDELGGNAEQLAAEIWAATALLDKLALYTTEVFQKSREELIIRQQQEMLELSTPVVELWEGILALPLIGTLDSNRTQIVMQNLLEAIVARTARIAIIDITGVPTVDTLVAQHLLKTVAAARLMGAECIISGIRPQIAQTIIHLGVDLGAVTTKATLSDAFQISLKRLGFAMTRA
jgi:rsbT co-antagonist protein RsbR